MIGDIDHAITSSSPDPRRVHSVWIVGGISGKVVGGMRRHMELHASGLEHRGIRVRLLFSEHGWSVPSTVARRVPGLMLLGRLFRAATRAKPDVINVHTLSAPAWILARESGLLKSRVVVMSYAADERGLPPGRGVRDSFRRRRIAVPARLLFPRASGIWCVNQEDAEYYASEYRVARERIAVIPHAIGRSFLERVDVQRDWDQLLFVGTWIQRKGSELLPSVMTDVLRRHRSCRFVIAGTLSPADSILRAFPRDVIPQITVHPHLDDFALRRLYQGSGLILIPSRLEGLPFSLLEAMAGGCPALAASNSGMKDVIRDGENGWLQDGFDQGAWARRVFELLADRPGRRLVSDSARSTAAHFDLDLLTRRTVAWYESLP